MQYASLQFSVDIYLLAAIMEILDVVQPKSRFVFELNTKETVELLATYMFGKAHNQSALMRGLCIFQRLLQIRTV